MDLLNKGTLVQHSDIRGVSACYEPDIFEFCGLFSQKLNSFWRCLTNSLYLLAIVLELLLEVGQSFLVVVLKNRSP